MSAGAAGSNVPSACLSETENDLVFTLVGNRKQTKATAVVQMFHAHPDRSQWSKFKTGVVCFVKDNVKKSYYIRLYDLGAKSMTYEQEVYNQFTYKKDRPYFHSFPGDKFTVGLNFADETEAVKFHQAVETKLQEREKKTTLRRNKDDNSAVPIARPPVNTVDAGLDPFSGSSNKKAKPKRPRGKISKSDIGAPSDFRHLSHVGFDPSTGAFDSSNIAPEWKKLLDTVGVTHEQLKDKSTADFIYDFVEKHGGIQEANRQLEEASSRSSAPPPPPNRNRTQGTGRNQGGRGLPPPPPRDRGAPPPPPPGRASHPPPKGGGAPPPPPPPPPIGGPAAPPPPPMSSGGRSGPPPPPSRDKPPPPSAPSSAPAVSDERGNLLASIRAGTRLKKVSAEDAGRGPSPPAEVELDGMAGALARALQQRSNVIQGSDSEEDEDQWGGEDEEDEWGSD